MPRDSIVIPLRQPEAIDDLLPAERVEEAAECMLVLIGKTHKARIRRLPDRSGRKRTELA
jgi:hypothetical protein